MTTAQEILSQPDVLLAIQKKRVLVKNEAAEIQNKLTSSLTNAFTPAPRAKNRVDFALNMARNAFNIWQGVTMGIKIVRGFQSAFKR